MQFNKLSFAITTALFAISSQQVALAEEESAEENRVIEVVVVTATKRQQTTQDIPLAIEVVSGATLEKLGINDITDMSNDIPSLNISNTGDTKSITMRGMGSPASQRGTEQAVAMYVDGVYKPRSKQYFSSFLDVERVEVLRGPQAVLFGINATAGAISVLSRSNEGGDDFESSVEVRYDMVNEGTIFNGVVGGGVTDELGLRLAIKAQDGGGYLENTLKDEDGSTESFSGRLSANWTPSEDLTINAKYDFWDTTFLGQLGENLWFGGTAQPGVTTPEKPDNKFENAPSSAAAKMFGFEGVGYTNEGYNFMVSADYDLGGHTITAIASTSELEAQNAFNFGGGVKDGFYHDGDYGFESLGWEDFEQSSIELRISSPASDFFSYVAGISYLTSEMSDYQGIAATSNFIPFMFDNVIAGGALAGLFPYNEVDVAFGTSNLELEQELLSAYITTTFTISEQFSITAGARYNDETKDAARNAACTPALSGGVGSVVVDNDRTGDCAAATARDFFGAALWMIKPGSEGVAEPIEESNFLPELAAHYRLNDQHTLFARVAKAAKSGGVSSSFASNSIEEATFDQETVIGMEFGVKSRVLDGAAEFNITAFTNSYEDLQVTSIKLGSAKVENAGEATVSGIEADGKMMVNDWLAIGGSLTLLDTEYDEYINGSCPDGNAVENGVTSPSVVNADGSCDMKGLPLIHAPDVAAFIYADTFFNLTGSLDFTAGVNISYSDEYFTEAKYVDQLIQESYSMVGAYVGISDVDGKWAVSLVGRNLTDELTMGPGVEFNALGIGSIAPVGNTPRTISLVARYNF
jgi:outer membrane receptor protein involved in Fe transport